METLPTNGNGSINGSIFGIQRADTLVRSDGDILDGGNGNDTFNTGGDILIGTGGNAFNTGGDILIGIGANGSDPLMGGTGSDRFQLGAIAETFGSSSVATITDFAVGIDKIILNKSQLTALQSPNPGDLLPSEFAVVNSDSLAGSSSAKIVYNSADGKLFYNPDGVTAGFGAGGQFATLIGAPANLSSTDFHVANFNIA